MIERALHRSKRARTSEAGRSIQQQREALTDLALVVHLFSTVRGTNSVGADLDLTAASVETEWGSGTEIHFSAEWMHSYFCRALRDWIATLTAAGSERACSVLRRSMSQRTAR
jgi:hypothetical protein